LRDPLPDDIVDAIARDGRHEASAGLEYFAEVDSTNDIAIDRAAAGAPEGTAILADLQRTGRGRRGRAWFSPPGAGLYLSIVARPPQTRLSLVTLAAGVAAATAVTTATGLPVQLKWPNDLVVGRAWRKLGGVLCEAVAGGAAVGAVVIGIGINLRAAAYPPEVADRAGSIESELGRPADRGALVVEVLAVTRRIVSRLREDRSPAWIREEWRRIAATGSLGALVRWTDGGAARHGVARDIDDDGALIVESGGRRERVIAGEVSWEQVS
jgi:BirA family biotin operon repressor/biotin-[acetyl-CoA-carboxylase] ligase